METTVKVYRIENDVLIVKATTEGCAGREYVSVTADRITPMLRNEIIDQQKEYLEEGELWRMAVAAEQTESSLSQWIDQFDERELLELADISLYSKTITYNDEDYNFLSSSCGCLHDEIKSVTKVFNGLISMHLSESVKDAELLISKIPTDDVDTKVKNIMISILKSPIEV